MSHLPSPDGAEYLIEVDRATVVRGATTVLRDFSLRIGMGQHTAILGANGCGKSTFIKLISRELYPLWREGAAPVRLFGEERWNVWDLRQRLGIVDSDLTHELQRNSVLQVEEAVLTGLFATLVILDPSAVTPTMRQAAREALAAVGALELAQRRCAELSTGEMRRVLIARCLVNRPRALLLDEPTAGLDPVARLRFVGLIGELARQGITIVLVTHHIEEIVPEIDRVVLMRAGEVLLDTTRAHALTSANLSTAFGGQVRVMRDGDVFSAVALTAT